MVQVFSDSIDEIAAIKYANMAVSSYATSPTTPINLDASVTAAQLPPPRKRSATHAIQYDNVKIMRDDDKANNNNNTVVDAIVPLSADVEVTRKLSNLSMVLSLFLFAHTHTCTHNALILTYTTVLHSIHFAGDRCS
jgi:hypothetical protein